jgi:hypothetical protein
VPAAAIPRSSSRSSTHAAVVTGSARLRRGGRGRSLDCGLHSALVDRARHIFAHAARKPGGREVGQRGAFGRVPRANATA